MGGTRIEMEDRQGRGKEKAEAGQKTGETGAKKRKERGKPDAGERQKTQNINSVKRVPFRH
jgi:hypothetical protein